jgi:hypothetical protein
MSEIYILKKYDDRKLIESKFFSSLEKAKEYKEFEIKYYNSRECKFDNDKFNWQIRTIKLDPIHFTQTDEYKKSTTPNWLYK